MKNALTLVVLLLLGWVFAASQAHAQGTMCYAAPGGNDSSDGSYWAFAKADIMACYDALPADGGTIFVRDGGRGRGVPACKPSDPPGCGIWLMGQYDPRYSSPPPGWRRIKATVSIMGVGGTSSGPFTLGNQVGVQAGGKDVNHPSIWISGGNGQQPMTFQNLSIGSCVPLRMGVDSTGNINTVETWAMRFLNDHFSTTLMTGCGPAAFIGSAGGWIFFEDSQFVGNWSEYVKISSVSRSSNVTTVTASAKLPGSWVTGMLGGITGVADSSFNAGKATFTVTGPNTFSYQNPGPPLSSKGGGAVSDQGQALVINPGRTAGTGLIYLTNTFLNLGGIKLYSGTNVGEVYVDNLLQESGESPAVWVASCDYTTRVTVKNVENADPAYGYPNVQAAANCPADQIILQNVQTSKGPALLLGGSVWDHQNVTPLEDGQYGIFNGYLLAQTNAARRGFGPVNSRFPNLARQDLSKLAIGGVTFAPLTAPDGTMEAVSVKTQGSHAVIPLFSQNLPVSPGDVFVCGAWVKALNGGYWSSTSSPWPMCHFTDIREVGEAWRIGQGSMTVTNGEWDWIWQAWRASYAPVASGAFEFLVQIGADSPIGIFAPVVIHIPAGTVSDNEAIEFAQTLQTFRDDATPGQVSLLRGEQFKADSLQVGSGGTITSGDGPPKGSAPSGSIYLRRDGASGSTFYIYENGAWKAQF